MATGGNPKNNPRYKKAEGYRRENMYTKSTPLNSRLNHNSPLGQLKAEAGVKARSKASQRGSGGAARKNTPSGNSYRVIKHGTEVKFK